MPYKTKTFDTSSATYTAGSTTFLVSGEDIGWAMDGIFRRHELSCSGLDGGKFAVKAHLVDDSVKIYNAGPLGEDTIVVIDDIYVKGVQLILSALGGSAVPKATITSTAKGL